MLKNSRLIASQESPKPFRNLDVARSNQFNSNSGTIPTLIKSSLLQMKLLELSLSLS
jgi:hypothetical protein